MDLAAFLQGADAVGVALLTTTLLLLTYYALDTKPIGLPRVNTPRWLDLWSRQARQAFATNAENLLKEGFSEAPMFWLFTHSGWKMILAPKYCNEIRKFEEHGTITSKNEFHSNIPGFEPFNEGNLIEPELVKDMIKKSTSKSAGHVFSSLSEESSHMVREMWTDDPGWRPIQVESTALQMIAHLTAGVFAGRQLCRDREWIDITIQYSMTAMVASEQLWRWPGWTRRLAARILPSCRLLSAQVQRADELAMAASQTRKNEAATTREVRTEQSTSYHDGLEWMEECARGRPYRPGVAQLSVTLGAVGTTKDLLMQVLYDTAGKDDLMDALREEIIAVVSEHGWTKAAIPNLQLMDSMIKESQRLKPVGITGIRRTPATDIHLSEGGIVPKGVPFEISNMHMWADADLYPNPRSFQADRFLRLRRVSGHEATAQLASMSADHLGWGLGRNACPARFFVAMEVKVLLCHLILKYDWTLEDGCLPEVRRYGTFLSADPEGKLLVRRRREEIDLDGALV